MLQTDRAAVDFMGFCLLRVSGLLCSMRLGVPVIDMPCCAAVSLGSGMQSGGATPVRDRVSHSDESHSPESLLGSHF